MRTTALALALVLTAPTALAQPRRRPVRPPRRPVPTQPSPPPTYVPPEPPRPIPSLHTSDPGDPFSGNAPPPSPPPSTSPPAETPDRPNALDLAVSARMFSRDLTYRENVGPARPYALGLAPAVRVDLAWHPGAHFTAGAGALFGLAAQFETAFALTSTDRGGARYETSAWSAFAALRVRLPIAVKDLDVAALAGWRLQSFTVRDESGSALATVPDMDVHALHFGVAARIPLPTRLALTLDAAYLHGLALGAFGDRFPGTSTMGVQASAGIAVRLPYHLEVRAGFEMRLWMHTLGAPPNVRVSAAYADDLYLGGSVGLALRL